MAIETTYKDVEIKVFTDKKKIHLTKQSQESLSLDKLMKVRLYISKQITKEACKYDVIVFDAA